MSETQTFSETSLTSFTRLFGQTIAGLEVRSIEIPLIQRDYAQGRGGETIRRIRSSFVETLCSALVPGAGPIGLDFVYGDMEKDTLSPLDGQQRLTTLFLLHWYIASRAGIKVRDEAWTNFSYATRPGARLFCQRLAEHQPEPGTMAKEATLTPWLTDQPWYLYTWRHDPTIQSMLVMLDELHRWFAARKEFDFFHAWGRLVDPQRPAISFHLLPLKASGLTDELYIKMNSRGKPLTPFENFKAHFEAMLHKVHGEVADEFARKIDSTWADILWHYRGDDNIIDDEFMRYFRFITEICAWQGKLPFAYTRTEDLAEKIYGAGNAHAAGNLKFLFKAMDTWAPQVDDAHYIRGEFERIFTALPVESPPPLILYTTFKGGSPVDLFGACCRVYGVQGQGWNLAHTLLLFGVLLLRVERPEGDDDVLNRRLRMLRNLIEASIDNEIRSEKMPDLLADVRRVVVDGTLHGVVAFNKAQVANEFTKSDLLEKQQDLPPVLHHLEDHRILRGCLAVFELVPSNGRELYERRSQAFHRLFASSSLWIELTAALLAVTDYSRRESRWTGHCFADFGAPNSETRWRELFRGKSGETMHPATVALMAVLDRVGSSDDASASLQGIKDVFLKECEDRGEFGWRYYFVKYSAMREGMSGRYTISPSGYQVCMLDKSVMRSNYRDPYLSAIVRESGVRDRIETLWFYGYETQPRFLHLLQSGVRLRCVDAGFQFAEAPTDPVQKAAFEELCANYGISDNLLFAMPQAKGIDSTDRVAAGARMLTDLVAARL